MRPFAVCLAVLGCSSTPDPVEVPSANTTSEVTSQPTAPPGPTSTAPSANLSRELSVTDCIALAQKYESVNFSDEWAKLPEGLSTEQLAVSRSQLTVGLRMVAERWEEGCLKVMKGSEYPEANLHCAMASKTVNAFEICLHGPADPAPPADTPKK